MRCRLCGFEFEPNGLACHAQCPMGERCSLICCPNCGYQVVDESKSGFARALKRVWRPRRGEHDDQPLRRDDSETVPLTHVEVGTVVQVERLEEMPAPRATRLSAFGLTPGTSVVILQRRPAPVVAIGETELALSEEILGQIRVRIGSSGAA
jgi:Fe2+ transport system protein FeoA